MVPELPVFLQVFCIFVFEACGPELSRSSRARLFSLSPDEEVSLFTRYLNAESISVRK